MSLSACDTSSASSLRLPMAEPSAKSIPAMSAAEIQLLLEKKQAELQRLRGEASADGIAERIADAADLTWLANRASKLTAPVDRLLADIAVRIKQLPTGIWAMPLGLILYSSSSPDANAYTTGASIAVLMVTIYIGLLIQERFFPSTMLKNKPDEPEIKAKPDRETRSKDRGKEGSTKKNK